MSGNIKDLKLRIKSVKSTQKITKAMKLVAAAKLRKAKDQSEAALPYASKMQDMLASSANNNEVVLPLLHGNNQDNIHLLIVITSDRGLCGSFNSSVVKFTKRTIQELQGQGKKVQLFCVGKKGYEQLKTHYAELIIHHVENIAKKSVNFSEADSIAKHVIQFFDDKNFDICHIIYNKFKNAISQIVTMEQLIPYKQPEAEQIVKQHYEYEPSTNLILEELLPKNIAVQIYRILLDSLTSEQGARMTAMDNATSSAGEMIKNLSLIYNRTRQAAITKELIEIISGSEAV